MHPDSPIEDGHVADYSAIEAFRAEVLAHYADAGRTMPWRETCDPWRILVSEVMLQQTQVARVIPAYERFLAAFPTPDALAAAPLEDVLRLWQGLGYNRRAVALKRAAGSIAEEHGGSVPDSLEALRALPGVGPTTAAGVMAFAFGVPGVYIETNVRAAFIHRFVGDLDDVSDREILPYYEAALDRADPRTWIHALMDYGAHIKKTVPNPSRRSRHYARQSAFEGSRRQKRARLLRAVLARGAAVAEDAAFDLDVPVPEAAELLALLAEEGFLAEDGGVFRVADS